jgi:hypothetical protein
MKSALSWLSRWGSLLLILVMLLIVFTSPFRDVYEYSSDEGRNLLRAGLIAEGYPLYTAIWNDQPPLFPAVLQLWLKVFGASAANGRLLTLVFSCGLVLAFYAIIKERWGKTCALAAGLLLLFSNDFMQIGISIMIGLPAIALAFLSLYCLRRCLSTGRKSFLFLSAAWMALSLLTKFSTALLIPAMVLELWLSGKERAKKAAAAAAWFAACAGLYFCVAILYFQGRWDLYCNQLFKPHLVPLILPDHGFSRLLVMLRSDLDIVFLALAGCWFAVKDREKDLVFPLVWFACSLAVLLNYQPIWIHYYPLLSLPLVWLAVPAIDRLKRKPPQIIPLACVLFACVMLTSKVLLTMHSLAATTVRQNAPAIAAARGDGGDRGCRWIYTNNPSIAFYAGMRVPPEILVSVPKRRFTGEEEQRFFISVMERYRPCRVLLFDFLDDSPLIRGYLREHYLRQEDVPLVLTIVPHRQSWFPFPFFLRLSRETESLDQLFPQTRAFWRRCPRSFGSLFNRIKVPVFSLNAVFKKPLEDALQMGKLEFFTRKAR